MTFEQIVHQFVKSLEVEYGIGNAPLVIGVRPETFHKIMMSSTFKRNLYHYHYGSDSHGNSVNLSVLNNEIRIQAVDPRKYERGI